MPDRAPVAASDAILPWWQHAGWYRAVTLAERLMARRSASASLPTPTPPNREPAQHRLQDWKAQPPSQHRPAFATRLAAEGVTEQELLDLLAEPPEALQARLTPPEWLDALRQAFDGAAPAIDLPEGVADERDPVAGFVPALHPLLAWGRHRLLLGIDALEQQYPHVPIDVPALVPSLLDALSRRLLAQVSRVFALELQVASRQWRLAGATLQARFDAFVQRLCHREALLALLEEYAVLAHQHVQTIDHWVAANLEMTDHLCADWQKIRATFAPEDDPGLLLEVGSKAGDRHRGGRSVLLLRFSSGWRLVYKPKSLAIDCHFQGLLCWLNACGAEPPLQPLRVLECGTYGWSAFVAEAACGSEEEVQRFYERQGAYLALLYVLEGTDLHCENVIAAGEYPMLVDLETLFQPRIPMEEVLGATEPAFEALQRSVGRVGLLPHRMWGNEEASGVNISGLGGEDGQLSPRSVPQWEGAGTDQLRLVHARQQIPVSQNRPRLHGQAIDAAPYRDRILPGIILFLAYLAALTKQQRYQNLAEAAFQNTRTLLTHPRKQEVIKSISAFNGWGGLMYLFSHLGSLWKEAALFQEAEELARLLPDLIEQDQQLDIIGGAAGCIAGLLSLYAVAPSPTMLELATRCGEHLLARAHPMQTGIGWKIPQQEIPLTGFAHGAAGIALSLLRLAAVSGDERFRHAALAAMAYERSLFSPERDNC